MLIVLTTQIMKYQKHSFVFNLFLCLIPSLAFGQWNLDNAYTPVTEVSLDHYASVQDLPGQNPELCLGLAVSGGGSRAQYFGTGVLMELSQLNNQAGENFLSEIDYYSTVSGGGYSIGYYMMVRKIGLLDTQSYFDYWKSEIPYHPEGLQSFVFMPASKFTTLKLFSYERRKKYKNSFPYKVDFDLLKAGSYRSYLDTTVEQIHLGSFFQKKCDTCVAQLPIFVANTTIYPNCERLPLMPHIISDLKIDKSITPKCKFDDDSGYTFPLAFAIAASSAVPGVLPIQRFGFSNSDLSIRVMDGGVVDNLGFRTLFELLLADKSAPKDKRMLIIDCSGLGYRNRYSDQNKKIKLFELLKNSSFFTVESKNLIAEETINSLEKANNIPEENDLVLGMQHIREKIKNDLTDAERKQLDKYRKRWKITEKLKNSVFEDMYLELARSYDVPTTKKDPPVRLGSGITSMKLLNSSNLQKALIYEMASHVITKVKIDEWEQEVLMLAGRLLVCENSGAILKLLD